MDGKNTDLGGHLLEVGLTGLFTLVATGHYVGIQVRRTVVAVMGRLIEGRFLERAVKERERK